MYSRSLFSYRDDSSSCKTLAGSRSLLVFFPDVFKLRLVRRKSNTESISLQADTFNLFYANQGGFEPAINNIYLAGIKVVEGILNGWNSTFAKGIPATNYIGDIFGSLGGVPDFGPGSEFNDNPVKKRSVKGRNAARGYA